MHEAKRWWGGTKTHCAKFSSEGVVCKAGKPERCADAKITIICGVVLHSCIGAHAVSMMSLT